MIAATAGRTPPIMADASAVPRKKPNSDERPNQNLVRLDVRSRGLDIRSRTCFGPSWRDLRAPMHPWDASAAATLLAASDRCGRTRGNPVRRPARGARGGPCRKRAGARAGAGAEGQEGPEGQARPEPE